MPPKVKAKSSMVTTKVKAKKVMDDDGDNDSSGQQQQQQGPTNEELRAVIRRLIPMVNLQKTGVKAFMKLLSKECNGLDLKDRSDFIKEALADAINEMDSDDNDDDDDDDDAKPAASRKGSAGGRGLSVKKEVSPALSKFLGQGKEMARTEVVKLLWAYIKENDLQNPENKREIILDDAMRGVFGVKTFTMFTMNKYVGAHIHPFKPVDLTPKAKPAVGGKMKRKRKASDEANSKKKRKPKKVGLQPPYRLSPELAEIVGKDILPRPQVVTALWDYIKSNNLQNPNDKREILCDSKLRAIMGGNEKVTMFNMNRFITEHLVEKLDRSAYVHDDTGGDDEEEEMEDDDGDDDDEDDYE